MKPVRKNQRSLRSLPTSPALKLRLLKGRKWESEFTLQFAMRKRTWMK